MIMIVHSRSYRRCWLFLINRLCWGGWQRAISWFHRLVRLWGIRCRSWRFRLLLISRYCRRCWLLFIGRFYHCWPDSFFYFIAWLRRLTRLWGIRCTRRWRRFFFISRCCRRCWKSLRCWCSWSWIQRLKRFFTWHCRSCRSYGRFRFFYCDDWQISRSDITINRKPNIWFLRS